MKSRRPVNSDVRLLVFPNAEGLLLQIARLAMLRHKLKQRYDISRTIMLAQLGLVVSILTLLVSGCGKSDNTTVHVKSPATGDKQLVVKSSCAFGETFTLPPDSTGKSTTVAAHDVFIANYDLACATEFGFPSHSGPEADGDLFVAFRLIGKDGSTAMSPTIGTYSVKPNEFGPESEMRIPPISVQIISRQGGTQNKNRLDKSGVAGFVTLKSISSDKITGEINLTANDTFIKGSFTSRVLALQK